MSRAMLSNRLSLCSHCPLFLH